MGTKVQTKMYSTGSGYYTIRNVDDNTDNGSLSLHRETRALKRDQYYDMFLTSSSIKGYSGHDEQQMRQTILNHEVTFRHQLHELHRVYKRQRDLMNEFECEKLYEDRKTVRSLQENIVQRDFVHSKPGTDGSRPENCRSFEPRCQKLQKRLFNLEVPADKYGNCEDVNFGNNGNLSSSNIWRHGLTDLNEPFQACEASPSSSKWESQKQIPFLSSNSNTQFLSKELLLNKRNDRFCLNDPPLKNERIIELSSYNSSIHGGYHSTKAQEIFKLTSLDQSTTESQKRKTIFGVDMSARSNNQPEKLQEGLQWLRKPIINGEEETSNKKQDSDLSFFKSHSQVFQNRTEIRKLFGVPIIDTPPQMKPGLSVKSRENLKDDDLVIQEEFNGCVNGGVRPHIDLNICLNEEDEVDLESPLLHENEDTSSCKENDLEDNARNAAEAIVVISSFCVPQNIISPQSQAPPRDDSLCWFAETISSYMDDLEKDKKVIPEIDYFEFMTLKLIETKLEEERVHYHKPVAMEIPKDEDEDAMHKKPRRGHPRRGKQKKDFQRDILPGLASLTRHEVAEDLQTIEDIIKITGGTWESSYTKRNAARAAARGKRRVKIAASVSPIKVKKINRNDLGLDEKSLTGWGKRTRRPPRNRYPTVNPALLVQ